MALALFVGSNVLEIVYHKREFTGGFTYQRLPPALSSAANEPDALPANCVPGSTG